MLHRTVIFTVKSRLTLVWLQIEWRNNA